MMWFKMSSKKSFCYMATLMLGLSLACNVSWAEQPDIPPGLVADDTTMLVNIDPAVLDSLFPDAEDEGEAEAISLLESKLRETRKILGNETVWMTVDWPKVPSSFRLYVNDADGQQISELTKLWYLDKSIRSLGGFWTFSIHAIGEADESVGADRLTQWRETMAMVPEAPVQIGMLPPEHLYATYQELKAELPESLGGGPVTLLTEGAQSGAVTIDPATSSIDGWFQSANDDAANAMALRLQQLLKKFVEDSSGSTIEWVEHFAFPAIEKLGITSDGDRVRLKLALEEAPTRFDLVPQLRAWMTGQVTQSSQLNRLKMIALGMLNYESANGTFPPGPNSPALEGKPVGLSWRVLILPYMEQNELYKKFALDEPWDSPTNIALLREMPDIYSRFGSRLLGPADAQPGMTTVVAPISEGTILGFPGRAGFGGIHDGSSNTILIVDVKDELAVPWTKPQGYDFDPDNAGAGLHFADGKTLVAMADGSAMAASRDNDWLHLFEMKDGNAAQLK